MPALEFQFHEGGIYFPHLRFWLDPHSPKEELVFVSHAHSDHVADHREVILSEPTSRLMAARMGGKRLEHTLRFNEPQTFQRGGNEFRISLVPAGHIFGSAMSLLECEGQTLLYTGDFKMRRGRSAEACEPVPADVLIMETTFGRPQYRFPPTDEVMRGVVRFCKEALDNDETAVLYGYSLGKSQEILCTLADAGLPIVLHGSVFNMTRVYEQFGHCFPRYEKYEAGQTGGKVVLCPPSVSGSAMLRSMGKTRCAVLTGWAVDPGCRFRYRCDAAFPLSDHADFPDLIEFVKQVQPKQVYTLHGFAADFAQTLRELGFPAAALSEGEQMTLALGDRPVFQADSANLVAEHEIPRVDSLAASPGLREGAASQGQPIPRSDFRGFAEACTAIGGTSSKLEKARLLAEYLSSLSLGVIPTVTIWFTGMPFAPSADRVLQVGWALLRDALCAVAEVDEREFHHVYLKHSDLGETAAELYQRRHAGKTKLGIQEVHALFESLQSARGTSSKLQLLVNTLAECSPMEVKFLVKIITSDLRIGLKEGLVEEGLARAFNVSADQVRAANLLLGNIGTTARFAAEQRLHEVTIEPFRAVKFMLASPEETAADIWKRLIEARSIPEGKDGTTIPAVWIEDKYDGIRCQLHKAGSRVALFSRDLKDITSTFHEVAEAARKLPANVILDGEILAMRGEVVLPFAELQKRLGRRENDLFLREEVPIQFVVFDLLWLNGSSLLDEPLSERRVRLDQLTPPTGLRLAQVSQAGTVDAIEAAFAAARARGNEGLIAKAPQSLYSPGRRGLMWLKLKKALATLDCVVVGAEYGHGKRSQVLSDYTFAVRDERTRELKTIGKAYTGLTDAEIAELTRHFLARTVEKRGRFHVVQPDIVLEIAFDRIQESARHSSGLALRFPRIVRIRSDKNLEQIDTVEQARRLLVIRDTAGPLA